LGAIELGIFASKEYGKKYGYAFLAGIGFYFLEGLGGSS
jgi:hypothetical protein